MKTSTLFALLILIASAALANSPAKDHPRPDAAPAESLARTFILSVELDGKQIDIESTKTEMRASMIELSTGVTSHLLLQGTNKRVHATVAQGRAQTIFELTTTDGATGSLNGTPFSLIVGDQGYLTGCDAIELDSSSMGRPFQPWAEALSVLSSNRQLSHDAFPSTSLFYVGWQTVDKHCSGVRAKASITPVRARKFLRATGENNGLHSKTEEIIGDDGRHFCALTQVGVHDIDNGREQGDCRVRTDGIFWRLDAIVTDNEGGEIRCEAICFRFNP